MFCLRGFFVQIGFSKVFSSVFRLVIVFLILFSNDFQGF